MKDRRTQVVLPGKTQVITDEREIIKAIENFQASTKKIWCACVESSIPAFSIGKVKQGYIAAADRGVKIMYLTEVTADNLTYCKQISAFAELRHLNAVRGNFALSESEYVAGFMEHGFMTRLVRTDVAEIVRLQHLIFETLWHHGIPLVKRIADL